MGCVICGKPIVGSTNRCKEHMDAYMPAGPVINEFHNCFKFVKAIIGPYGSSKSVGCCFDLFYNMSFQNVQEDGKKRSRYAVIRPTYRELEDSTIRTWQDWFGDFGELKTSENIFYFKYGDIESEIFFRALDRPDDVKKLLSVEYTKAWINESREASEAVFKALTGRVGRYPSKKDGGAVLPGVIMDTNPPDEDHWMYRIFEQDIHKDPQIAEEYAIFRQPPGAVLVKGKWEDNFGQVPGIPKAENIENLPEGYYRRMCVGKDREWIKVYVEGKYGFVQDGKPVFSQYNDELHCAEFEPDPELPLMLGFDAGLTPAVTIGQLSKRGQLRIVDEVVSKDMDMYSLARDVLKPLLTTRYPGFTYHSVAWGDPAKTRGDAAKHSAIGMLNDAYSEGGAEESEGIKVLPLKLPFATIPAPGDNSISPRLSSVNFYLTKLIDGAPGFLVHPRCVNLRKGFLGKYRFERVQVSGDERFKEIPKKNVYSHIHDSLQNLCLGTLDITELEDDDFQYSEPQATAFSGR